MFAAADLAWEGGTAQYGDEVDETSIPAAVRARLIDGDFLVDSPPAPREEAAADNVALGDEIA